MCLTSSGSPGRGLNCYLCLLYDDIMLVHINALYILCENPINIANIYTKYTSATYE